MHQNIWFAMKGYVILAIGILLLIAGVYAGTYVSIWVHKSPSDPSIIPIKPYIEYAKVLLPIATILTILGVIIEIHQKMRARTHKT